MIPGLLHQRRPGPAAPGVIPAPSYQYVLAHQYGVYSAVSVGHFAMHPDGTWTSDGTNYPDRSGTWHNAPAAGVGAGRSVRVTLTKDFTPDPDGRALVDASITNEAAGWVALGGDRLVTVTLARYTPAPSGIVAKYVAKVEIRDDATALVVSTGTFNVAVAVQVDQNAPSGGSGGGSDGDGSTDGKLPA